jgi:intracellular septation protein A
MKELLLAARGLLLDMAATLLFAALYALSGRVMLAVAAGMVLALAQIGWSWARREKVIALQWVSLVLVLSAGGATLWTHDLRFVMFKPAAIYALVGASMLQKNWMARYMPSIALAVVPDLITGFGYVWAGLMFLSAVVVVTLALSLDVLHWGAWLVIWGTGSKAALFLSQYAVMRLVGRRRWRAGRLATA